MDEIAPGIKRCTIATGVPMYQMRLNCGRQPARAHTTAGADRACDQRPDEADRRRVPHELAAGDAFYLGSNVPHGVETIDDTTVIDTFSPPREDYLALDEKARRVA